jgi:Protein of unknown function (DUF2735)
MTKNHEHRGSATIYEFPARGRFAMVAQSIESKAAVNRLPLRVARIAYGSSWYHEEAVQDAERGLKS